MTGVRATAVDTDAFSHLYVRLNSADSRVSEWRELLRGHRVLISFQTHAELLTGAIGARWGERRMAELRAILDRTPTIRADNEVIEAHASLAVACQRIGHGLQHRQHTGDRWVAACAIAKGVDLLAGDGIYVGAPGLSLLS
ncbi:MAG: PIN domain-containing protein [Candidatus Nanopelagicales bacterium]